jgi:hypothetical protein
MSDTAVGPEPFRSQQLELRKMIHDLRQDVRLLPPLIGVDAALRGVIATLRNLGTKSGKTPAFTLAYAINHLRKALRNLEEAVKDIRQVSADALLSP